MAIYGQALGKDASSHQDIYRLFLSSHIDSELLEEIRDNTHKGMSVGRNRLKQEIETMTKR